MTYHDNNSILQFFAVSMSIHNILYSNNISKIKNGTFINKNYIIKFRITFESGTDMLPNGETSTSIVLSQSQLHVEKGKSAEDEHDAIRDQECTC